VSAWRVRVIWPLPSLEGSSTIELLKERSTEDRDSQPQLCSEIGTHVIGD